MNILLEIALFSSGVFCFLGLVFITFKSNKKPDVRKEYVYMNKESGELVIATNGRMSLTLFEYLGEL